MDNDDDYEVGYAKPPKHSQFKKGQSGNPRGRPKGSQNFSTLLSEQLDSKVQVTDNGVNKTMTMREAIVRRIVTSGLTGKPNDALKLLKTIEAFVPQEVEPPSGTPDEIIVKIVKPDGQGGVFSPTDEEVEHLIDRRRKNSPDWNPIFDPNPRPDTVDQDSGVDDDDEADFLK